MFWLGLDYFVALPTPKPNLFYSTPTPGLFEDYFNLEPY